MPFSLSSPSSSLYFWTFGLTAVLPIAITGIALIAASRANPPWGILLAISLPLVMLAGVFSLMLAKNSVEISGEKLVIKAAFYAQEISLSDLDIAEAKVLGESNSIAFGLRENGIGLPGYQAGWFRLRDGGKAFVAVTRGPANLRIPTLKGYELVLSVKNPTAFLNALEQKRR